MRSTVSEASSRRRASDVVLLAAASAALALSALPVRPGKVSALEEAVFRLANRAPELPFLLFWLPMQAGNVLAAAAASLLALVGRRRRLALALALAGPAAWVSGKLVKQVVERGRPAGLLDEVVLRGAPSGGLGFVSGHAAVVVAMTVVAWRRLGPRGRVVSAAAAALVCLLRVYVGAHLPLDVVGGAALGLAAGCLVNLLVPPERGPRGEFR